MSHVEDTETSRPLEAGAGRDVPDLICLAAQNHHRGMIFHLELADDCSLAVLCLQGYWAFRFASPALQ